MAEKWPEKLYALRGGPVVGYLEAALIVNDSACQRNGIEVAAYVPEPEQTEYQVIGEADLDTIPIRRVGWAAPHTFDTLEAAQDYLAEVKRTDPGAINPRIEERGVGDWAEREEK